MKDGQKYAYFPYGEPRVGTGDHFATYQRDATTSFDYAMNRYYSNVAGRFLTPDPYGGSAHTDVPQSWNRYTYVQGDPMNGNDPSGRDMIQLPSGAMVDSADGTFVPINECGAAGGLSGGALMGFQLALYDSSGAFVGLGPGFDPETGWSSLWVLGGFVGGCAPPPRRVDRRCTNPAYAQALNFVKTNLGYAQQIASELNTTPGDILGLSGLESGWGTGFLITAGTGNYFSLTAGPAFGGTTGTYKNGSYTYGVYPAPGFLTSGESFANSYFGSRGNGISDPLKFAEALNADGSFNSENLPTPYEQAVAAAIKLANVLLSCP